MKRDVRTALTAGCLVLGLNACTGDPLAGLRGTGPRRLVLSASTLTVNIQDSVAVTVTVEDEQGNPLPDAATASSAAPGVVSVSPASGAPLPVTKFFVKGVSFGSGYVRVTAGAVSDSINVLAYPAAVTVAGQVDSLDSGLMVGFAATARDAAGAALAGVSPFRWKSNDSAVAIPTSPGATTTVSGYAAGVAIISVTLPGGANALVPLRVVPAPFNGTKSASSGGTLAVITVDRGPGSAPFDADVLATFGGEPGLLKGDPTADQIQVVVPPVDSTVPRSLVFSNIGPKQLAQRTAFTVNATSLDDSYEPANDDPSTAPSITSNGDYFAILHGDCHPDLRTDPGLPHKPTDDCDDFFTIANGSGSNLNITATLSWRTDADVDVYFTDAGNTTFVSTDGATVSNPEVAVVTIPPLTTYRIWLNLYDGFGGPWSFVRLRISGLP